MEGVDEGVEGMFDREFACFEEDCWGVGVCGVADAGEVDLVCLVVDVVFCSWWCEGGVSCAED